ncbi:GNAT family N-acetyltransferase [Halorussus marinus]|uniref:GNAT family N-acetyltransferase n=1 Tax=Halorussus marinus TaxID=2505976 RepID=UPI0010927B19|nr:GNAT family N-acetyltransferase [Halorussus marinus]
MTLDVRVAVPDDAPAVRRVARASWLAAYDDVVAEETIEAAIADWYDVADLRASIGRADARMLIAERGDEVVGFGQALVAEPTDEAGAELARLYVHPDRWNEGIGSTLLDRLEDWLRERGADGVRLAVLADNDAANAFYESRGYRRVDSREMDLKGETVDDYVREKGL